jgi:dienelactone hydrolase
MALRKLQVTCVGYVLVFLLANPGCMVFQQDSNIIHPAKSLPSTTPWDLIALSQRPEYEWSDQESPVWSLYYKGESYKNQPTRVFAYFASPSTLEAKSAGEKVFPAVVLVHGGGGTAYKEWAEMWAKRGYAAIAMDLGGCGLGGGRLADGGPSQGDDVKFGDIDLPVEDQWTYHAVSNVIKAHSLIRSFKEVDSSHTAVIGISWGGYLTCIVSGLDIRFKAAVPVYGCGFLHENSWWLGYFAKMSLQQKTKWIRLWDPSVYVGSTTMPIFFLSGTHDRTYPLDSYAKTYRLVKGIRNLRILIDMPHSHVDGWAPEEIGFFVDQYLKGGVPLPVIMKPKLTDQQVCAKVKSKTLLSSANLHYTTGTSPINALSWKTIPASVKDKRIISSAPPDEATIWFLTVTDSREVIVSSEIVFAAK